MIATQPNRLIHAASPYLQQHAHNPVDWYPWGPEALERARTEDRPILLSIGYSTCHWCHVMAHESFSDPRVADLMNRHFVCIKVDREERPDLDKLYITAVSALSGGAGWPLNVFLTPERHPFFGGTYFPPDPRPGRPSWAELLRTIARSWEDPLQREKLLASGRHITASLAPHLAWKAEGRGDPNLPQAAVARLRVRYDAEFGGFGPAPKFPTPGLLQFLLDGNDGPVSSHPSATDHPSARQMALGTLRAMARGGIFDHIGGGFHRYATDRRWHVPHFEKMLYDNAQLLSVYIEAFQATGDTELAAAARATADYVLRDLRHPDGGFFAAEDADSRPAGAPAGQPPPKKEGAFYLWRHEEAASLLDPDQLAAIAAHYDLRPQGNVDHDPQGEFTGQNILYQAQTMAETAAALGRAAPEVARLLDAARNRLLAARSRRERPGRDGKVITAWNGLMISALAQAGQVLHEPAYTAAARNGADFLLDHLAAPSGDRLFRCWCDGTRQIPGIADDYLFFVQALLDLYAADFQPHWLAQARRWMQTAQALFCDAQDGGFFLTGTDHDPHLILRVKEDTDSVLPSAAAVGALNLLRLARLTGREDYAPTARKTIDAVLGRMSRHPEAAPVMLRALRLQQRPWIQVTITGAREDARTQQLIDAVRAQRLTPVVLPDDATRAALVPEIPSLAHSAPARPRPAAHVCIARSCRDPLESAAALDALLQTAIAGAAAVWVRAAGAPAPPATAYLKAPGNCNMQ